MAMNWIETLRTEEPDALTRVRYMFNPLRLKMSPQFHAIVACLLGVQEVWTQPEFAHMYITSDNFLLGMRVGDCGANDFIGSSDDLIANLKGLVELHELTDDEKRAFVESANNHISNSSATFDLAKALNVSFEEVEVTVSHCRLHVWKGTTVRDLIVNHPDLCEGVEYKETDEKDSDGYPVKEVVPIDIDGAIERGDLIIHCVNEVEVDGKMIPLSDWLYSTDKEQMNRLLSMPVKGRLNLTIYTKGIWVNMIQRAQQYGGPEEGGWYYDESDPIITAKCNNMETAEWLHDLLEKSHNKADNHKYYSVLNRNGEYIYYISGEPAVHEPKCRPHYC